MSAQTDQASGVTSGIGSGQSSGKTIHREIDDKSLNQDHENRDALTGTPGSHPVGTGVGAAAAGAAGAAIGSIVPGVGTVIGGAVGAVVGAVAGGLAGKGIAERINPTDESAYWRTQHQNRHYYDPAYNFENDYGPAYTSAVDAYNAAPDRPFDDSEPDLRNRWEKARGNSKLDWDRAKQAMRDVYDRDRSNKSSRGTSNRGNEIDQM